MCYRALAQLPIDIRPDGYWQSPVSLNECQQGDPALANEIRDTVAALANDAEALLPPRPVIPPPEQEAA